MKNTRNKDLEALRALYRDRRPMIRKRLAEFSAVPENDYFYEMAYCLLTPQSSAEHADRAVRELQARSFAEAGGDAEEVLRNPVQYIRFHRTKSRHLVLARETFPTVLEALRNGHSAEALREWLVRNVKGFGYKEATHFLRNIGRNDGLAILDRHILRNLKRYGAIRAVPAALSRKTYLSIEARFRRFSETIGIPLDELDLLFWSMETGSIRK